MDFLDKTYCYELAKQNAILKTKILIVKVETENYILHLSCNRNDIKNILNIKYPVFLKEITDLENDYIIYSDEIEVKKTDELYKFFNDIVIHEKPEIEKRIFQIEMYFRSDKLITNLSKLIVTTIYNSGKNNDATGLVDHVACASREISLGAYENLKQGSDALNNKGFSKTVYPLDAFLGELQDD